VNSVVEEKEKEKGKTGKGNFFAEREK
jgi:hypothetical protein